MQYAQYQIKWLRKRIFPIFQPDLAEKTNLLYQIVLNDPAEYETIALNQGVQFVTQMIKYYNQSSSFDLERYADHFVEIKAARF